MYAIAFDLDTKKLEQNYRNASWENAYKDIGNVLVAHGFKNQQGSVYFGDAATVDAVTTVLAIMDVTQKCAPWFAVSVRDVRMLRIEDNNDLLPAVRRASGV